MLWKLLRDMPPDNRPTHLAVIFDKSEVTFRNKLYPEYKAHRPPAPDDLIPQFALIREAVRAFDLPCLEQGGFAADDLIATYAREAGELGATATIVSSDKDLMQLVTDKVTMYDTMKDRRIGIAEVIEKFGVPPEKVVEVQALAGDSTDNVPGVPGIGIKTAAQLIVEYGDLETLLKRAGEIKQPKRRESLLENAGLAPDQIKAADALAALKPLLESAGILKIGFNIKFNAVMLAQHGITLRNHDDAQLMSYALDAGRNSHASDALAERWLGHAVISYGDLTGSGKNRLSFDQVAIDKATEYSAECADVTLRLWRVLKPRLVAERMTAVYETLERPLISV